LNNFLYRSDITDTAICKTIIRYEDETNNNILGKTKGVALWKTTTIHPVIGVPMSVSF